MSMTLSLTQETGFLRVRVNGVYEVKEAIDKFRLVVAACEMTGLDGALIDYRSLEGDILAVEKAIYAIEVLDMYEQHVATVGRPLRLAYLGKAPEARAYQPGLDLARQRQYPVILTADPDEALEWVAVSADR